MYQVYILLVTFGHMTFTSIFVDALTLHTTYEGIEDGYVKVFDGDTNTINVQISQMHSWSNLTIELKSSNEDVFQVEPELQHLDIEELETVSLNATIIGVFIGVEILHIRIINDSSATESTEVIKVFRVPSLLNFVFTYFLLIWLIVSYVTMGTKLDLKLIWENVRRPVGVTIGMFCQFIVMPLLAFCLAVTLSDSRQSAIGLIVEGSSPGGWYSNIFTLLLDCDFVLSLTMTFCSTIAALGFMPLNMFIYANKFIEDDEALKTPFVQMVQQFALMLVPVLVGIFIRYKLSKLKDICLLLLKPFAWILIVVSLALGVPSNIYIFQGSWQIWVLCAFYPFIGGLLGFFFATITRRKCPQAVTIALETGVQNSVLATIVIRLAYPQPEADIISRIPLLISLTTLIEGCSMVLVYITYQRLCKKKYTAVQEVDPANAGNESIDGQTDTEIRLDENNAS
ncbi:ileal sodium/bile acid cotransporter-like [Anneissia japonica]|uniref:ileal sodium/bile acid cotransporter-like n=1 Tax=Anneissia japonica TaxID=1529436 RepID=UPI00142568F1|nr:ileal sodium/bile acid cotransporter-like [Anneissia japonica]